MSQGLLVFLPGLCGSELYLVNGGGGRVKAWLDPSSVFWGTTLETLAWGATPPGMMIQAGEPLALDGWGYPGLLANLARDFTPQGYQVLGLGYDWRDGVINNGILVANFLRLVGRSFSGILILTHSMGGLVGQVACAKLKETGDIGLVRACCAICPPWAGSYGSAEVWREQESGPDLIGLANAGSLGGRVLSTIYPGSDPNAVQAANRQRAIAMYESWPSTYDLLPMPSAMDDPQDKLRDQVYLGSVWAPALVPPDVPKLIAARDTTWPYLMANPPDRNLWTVVGCVYPGVYTPQRLSAVPTGHTDPPTTRALLQNPSYLATLLRRAQLPGLEQTSQGDGRVTLASQLVWGVPSMLVRARHEDACNHPTVLANLPPLLRVGDVKTYPAVDLAGAFPTAPAA